MGGIRGDGPTVTGRIAAALAWWLLPSPCLACETLEDTLDRELGLCPSCRGALRRLGGHRCRLCLRRLPAAPDRSTPLCGSCLLRRPPHDALAAGWSYEPPFDAVIHALKFGRQAWLGRQIGRRLGRERAPLVAELELVVPVPLHWRRRLARGYNQAAEIAAGLCSVTGLPSRPALTRRRATRRQTTLPFERRAANVRRAFLVRRPDLVRGRRCLLLDDVVTTGATIEQAARALRRAGAASVVCLAAGRTPQPGTGRPE